MKNEQDFNIDQDPLHRCSST